MAFTSSSTEYFAPIPVHHHRSESEFALTHLHLTLVDEWAVRKPRITSEISEEDLEALCTPLGKSIVEEEEEQFALDAMRALSLIKTPDGPDMFSAFDKATEVPDVVDDHYNPFFQRRLYSSSPFERFGRSHSSGSSSNCSTPGSYFSQQSSSSSASSSGPSTPPPVCHGFSKSSFSANFSHRHITPATLQLPSSKRASAASNRGLLRNNFGGIEARSTSPSTVPSVADIDPPLTPRLRTRSSNGFAF